MCCPPKSEEVKRSGRESFFKERFHSSGNLLSDPQHNANFWPIKRTFIHSFDKYLQGTCMVQVLAALSAEKTDKFSSLTQLGEGEGRRGRVIRRSRCDSAILGKVGALLDHQTPQGGLPGGGEISADINSTN